MNRIDLSPYRSRFMLAVLSLAIAGTFALSSAIAMQGERISNGYMNHESLAQRVHTLAAEHDSCRVEIIGRSMENRALFAMTLSNDFDRAMQRPALLITAGLDARHWVGAETAVRVAERLLVEHGDLLDVMTVYIVPRVNPDGAELNFGPINYGHVGNLRPVDLDRDGEINEDGPNDLNGDGVISMMRRLHPTLDDPPTHLPDPNEPRLLKEPDQSKGEIATMSLYVEGFDEDDDGAIAEDGPGYVDLDRNFPHLYPEHATGAGLHQMSEPETRAMAEFVIGRRNIVAAITYGRHDNMIHIPDHRRMDVTGRTPIGILENDLQLYQSLSDVFKETTGQERAPREDAAGSFHAWLYAHRGITSIATVVWGRPDVNDANAADEPADEADGDEQAGVAEVADPISGTWVGTVDLRPMQAMAGDEPMPAEMGITLDLVLDDERNLTGSVQSEMGPMELHGSFNPPSQVTLVGETGGMAVDFALEIAGSVLSGQATAMGMSLDVRVERDQPEARPAAQPSEPPARRERGRRARTEAGAADAEAAAWLAYSDQRGGIGFVEWQPFEHPQLGAVEIGGFVPGFKMNPPADELDALADAQTAFAVEIINRRPELRFAGPEITQLGPGLFDVRLAIINDGALPTMTAMARRARVSLPVVLRLSTELDRIVAGERVNRAWGIEGQGGRYTAHWTLHETEGELIEIELVNHQLGDLLLLFELRPGAELSIIDLPEDRR